MGSNKSDIVLRQLEALPVAIFLWSLLPDISSDHDSHVEAIYLAALLESKVGIPAWPTHAETIAAIIDFYEPVVDFLRCRVEKNHYLKVSDSHKTDFAGLLGANSNLDVVLKWEDAKRIRRLLWKVVSDSSVTHQNRVYATRLVCLIESKIGFQHLCESTEEDMAFYQHLLGFLEKHIEEMRKSILKKRP